MLNPYFTRANPNFWHKYIVFFQNTMFLKRVLNPCQTRTLPVQTRTICSGSEGSHLCHFCCNISTDSYDHMKIDIASESLVGDVGYLCYPLVKRELRSHQEFPNHMFVGGCGQECWNMLEYDDSIHFSLHHQNCKFENIGFCGKTSCFFSYPTFL